MPYQLIYTSVSSTPMQMDDLEDILESARESNAEVGISGALTYIDGCFLQILEGKAEEVLELMGRIRRDVRHETVIVLKHGDVPTANFSDWNMAYVSATADQIAMWAGLSGTTSVPDIMTDIRGDALKVERIAEQILRLLGTDTSAAAAPSEPGAA